MSEPHGEQITNRRLLAFFVPLGLSASLVTISHVIINGTLARADQAEVVISAFAIAMSLLGITERPAVLLRQTCSALVRDRVSFRAMGRVTLITLGSILAIGTLLCYTPLGRWIFLHVFGAEPGQVSDILSTYRILMFVSIFSGIRCMYHGIIISNMRTKWLTIGMAVRLSAMYALSLWFIETDNIYGPEVGASIFLLGMAIEAGVAYWEGRKLALQLPARLEDHPVAETRDVARFYKPLLYSSAVAMLLGPAINAMLGKTTDMHIAIASFAIASSVMQLVVSFFGYIHQIVLNFHRRDAAVVKRFVVMMSLIPTMLLGIAGFTPAGPWFLGQVMGVGDSLMGESIDAIRTFMILTLLFPWLDYCNGYIMLIGQTKAMMWSQVVNVTVTFVVLAAAVSVVPGWHGAIGALAMSLGVAGELAAVAWVVRRSAAPSTRGGRAATG